MFHTIRRRIHDARTISWLCREAEQAARTRGQARPGSEHFVLAALGLPDGSGRTAFGMLGIDAAGYADALDRLDTRALEDIGIATGAIPTRPQVAGPAPRLFQGQPSAQTLIQRLADAKLTRQDRSLTGADLLLMVAEEQHSPAVRAFLALGVSPARLKEAAQRAIGEARSWHR